MKPRTLDALSTGLLLLWTGMALEFALVSAPALFQALPARDLAGSVVTLVLPRLDWAAFAAFGLALAFSAGGRWLQEVGDALPIGPLRLWSFAALAGLLLTFASAFVVTPKVHEIRARLQGPIESFAPDHPDRAAHRKAHGISAQFLVIRMLLAVGLAATAARLPREQSPEPEPSPGRDASEG
ncbi:MAG: DUF4149 domain-containing protein [Holophagaceae bacterium]